MRHCKTVCACLVIVVSATVCGNGVVSEPALFAGGEGTGSDADGHSSAVEGLTRHLDDNGGDGDTLASLLVSCCAAGREQEARRILLEWTEKNASETRRREALTYVEKALARLPDNRELLLLKGELLEAQKEHLAAYYHYEDVLKLYPRDRAARSRKYRSLMSLGAISLAGEKLAADGDPIDEETLHGLMGDEAMWRIRWEEPDLAAGVLQRNARYIDAMRGKVQPRLLEAFATRTWGDRIAALQQKRETERVIREYESSAGAAGRLPGSPPPKLLPWVAVSVSQSYLDREKPRRALTLLGGASPEGEGGQSVDGALVRFRSLLELGRFREAGRLLDALDRRTPARVIDRGVWRDNWWKEELARNYGWWLIYQDRFREAQRYLNGLLLRAPANTHTRTALAHAYLWRGWPRRALTEFEIARSMDPESFTNEIGCCYALDRIGRGGEARLIAQGLMKRYPGEREVRELNRFFAVQDKSVLAAGGESSAEYPGARGTAYYVQFTRPVMMERSLFARVAVQNVSEDDFSDELRRGFLGAFWRLNRDVLLNGSLSGDFDRNEPGFSVGAELAPSDFFALSAGYDSFSLSVPLRVRARGINADEKSMGMRYRPNETFTGAGEGRLKQFSDGNDEWQYSLKFDKAILASAYLKPRLVLEGFHVTNSRQDQDVDYFSPEYFSSLYLGSAIEHVWYRRFKTSVVARLSAAAGREWQKGFESRNVWYARYEQEIALSDLTAFVAKAGYDRQFYEAQGVDIWTFNLSFNQRF